MKITDYILIVIAWIIFVVSCNMLSSPNDNKQECKTNIENNYVPKNIKYSHRYRNDY